jgi:cyd operon protein YbgT
MWYFTWILGLLLACSLGIINVLRLEAQETWEKEHIAMDPLTQLMTKDAMLLRLKEKIENSRLNGFPFSILTINLTGFVETNQFHDYEVDATLRKVADYLKEEIRAGVDIIARMDKQTLLIAFPGLPLKNAEETALRFKEEIFARVKAPKNLAVEVVVSVVQYPVNNAAFTTLTQEVENLLRLVCGKVHTA